MSLPPLLLERLKRRKIIQEVTDGGTSQNALIPQANPSKTLQVKDQTKPQDQDEEILAEDHSEEVDQSENTSENLLAIPHGQSTTTETNLGNRSIVESHLLADGERDQNVDLDKPILCCPNKYNIYHTCSKYCQDNYGSEQSSEPTLDQKKYLTLLLRAYPLPTDWITVYDPGVKTFYFWDTKSDLVSWLPPMMGSFITPPADTMKKSMQELSETSY